MAIDKFNAAHFCTGCATSNMHQQVNAFCAIGMGDTIHILHYLGHHLMVLSDLSNHAFLPNWKCLPGCEFIGMLDTRSQPTEMRPVSVFGLMPGINYNHPVGEQMPPGIYMIISDYSNSGQTHVMRDEIDTIDKCNVAQFCPGCVSPTMRQHVDVYHNSKMTLTINVIHYLGHHLMVMGPGPCNLQLYANWFCKHGCEIVCTFDTRSG